MRLIVEVSGDSVKTPALGQRLVLVGHVTRVEQERIDVTGFVAGKTFEETLPGEATATLVVGRNVFTDDDVTLVWR